MMILNNHPTKKLMLSGLLMLAPIVAFKIRVVWSSVQINPVASGSAITKVTMVSPPISSITLLNLNTIKS